MNGKLELNNLEKKLNKMNNKKRYKKYILNTFIVIFSLGIIYFCCEIIFNLNDKNKIRKEEKQILDNIDVVEIIDEGEIINPPEEKTGLYWEFINYNLIEVDINKLKQKNNDTIGWIQVNNTNINYPIVQTTNNDYYLEHQFNKGYNSAGWIFMDFRNNKDMSENKNTIIYGHGLKNRAMFGSLKNTLSSNWYDNSENLVIKTVDEKTSYLWQVFSIYTIITNNDYIKTVFFNDEEFLNFLNLIKNRSVKNFNVDLNSEDKIITLSTCYTEDKKLVLHAKLIKKN